MCPQPVGSVGVCRFSINENPLFLKIGDTQKLDTYVDINLPSNGDSMSIFSKVIVCELSHGSSGNIYLLCCTYFMSTIVQTKAPHFVELGLPDVNTSDEVNILGTPATRIISPTYGSHFYALPRSE